MPVVAHSSPEGSQLVDAATTGAAYSEFIVPMDDVSLNDDDGDRQSGFAPTAQLVLVCSWRSMKEVSLMLGDLVQRLNQSILTVEQVRLSIRLFYEKKRAYRFEKLASFLRSCSRRRNTLERLKYPTPVFASIARRCGGICHGNDLINILKRFYVEVPFERTPRSSGLLGR